MRELSTENYLQTYERIIYNMYKNKDEHTEMKAPY